MDNRVADLENGPAAGAAAAGPVGGNPGVVGFPRKVAAAIERVERIETEPTISKGGTTLQHPLHYSYLEIKNELWIERDPVFRATLKEWDRKEAYLGNRVDRREKTSADLRNQIFNIVGFFSVFQGVVLTAVSQLKSSTGPHCGKIWFPIVLSSVALVVTVIGVWLKFTDLEELELSITNEKQAQRQVTARAAKLRAKGKNFRFHTDVTEPRLKNTRAIWISRYSVIVALILFTGIFILSYFVILCDSLAIKRWNNGL